MLILMLSVFFVKREFIVGSLNLRLFFLEEDMVNHNEPVPNKKSKVQLALDYAL